MALKLLSAGALFCLSAIAQVTNPAVSVQSDPGGSCALGSAPQVNVTTGQYWNCVVSKSGNLTVGAWAKSSPADNSISQFHPGNDSIVNRKQE